MSALDSFEGWVRQNVWIGRKRRIGISIWSRDPRCKLPLYEWHEGEGHVRIPFTRWCLATYKRRSR